MKQLAKFFSSILSTLMFVGSCTGETPPAKAGNESKDAKKEEVDVKHSEEKKEVNTKLSDDKEESKDKHSEGKKEVKDNHSEGKEEINDEVFSELIEALESTTTNNDSKVKKSDINFRHHFTSEEMLSGSLNELETSSPPATED